MNEHNNSPIDQLLQLSSGPFLIDNMKNEASEIYGSFPERLYIILNDKIVYQVNSKVIYPGYIIVSSNYQNKSEL